MLVNPKQMQFKDLPVGARFRISPTPSCSKGQSPLFQKIDPEEDPMDTEGPWRNYQLARDPSKKNFLYGPILVLIVD
jgi:hypothetical protein